MVLGKLNGHWVPSCSNQQFESMKEYRYSSFISPSPSHRLSPPSPPITAFTHSAEGQDLQHILLNQFPTFCVVTSLAPSRQ